jgi:primase-polymerase (primpol)-like protein
VDTIPEEMREAPRWVAWRYAVVNGKKTKVPYTPAPHGSKVLPMRKASSTDGLTWRTFGEAIAVYRARGADGIGFVLGDGWIGIDLDHQRNAETGEVTPVAQEVIRAINSYTEVSPSGAGFHIIAKGVLPEGRRKRGDFEMYSDGRYFTVTGWRV